jgi:hypothetical protein
MPAEDELILLRYRLAEVLVPLAASYSEQNAYLQRTNTDVSELALDFDWTRQWTPQLQAADLLPESIGFLLDAIDSELTTLSSAHDPAVWTGRALQTVKHWNVVRKLAARALYDLGALGVVIPSIDA